MKELLTAQGYSRIKHILNTTQQNHCFTYPINDLTISAIIFARGPILKTGIAVKGIIVSAFAWKAIKNNILRSDLFEAENIVERLTEGHLGKFIGIDLWTDQYFDVELQFMNQDEIIIVGTDKKTFSLIYINPMTY